MIAPGSEQTNEILPGIRPRQYQLDAVGALADLRTQGVERGLVTMATGLGKTAVGVLDVHNFLQEQNNPDTKFLFLTHNNDIIDQSWRRFYTSLAGTDLRFNYLQPGRTIDELLGATYLFASFQMMDRGRFHGQPIRDIFDRDHFAHILVDEAHHAMAPTYKPTIQYFTPQFRLGLTATPDRHDGKDIRYIFGKEVYRKSLPEGIAEGYLARPHYIGIAPKATIKVVREGTEGEEFARTLDRATAQEITKDAQKRIAHIKDPKILVYTGSIQEADLYAELFPQATALHSNIPRAERQDTLEDFRNTRPSTLTSVDMINEGVDIPDVDVILMARSTASETLFLQQLGRGLRLTETKKEVLILDYVANSDRLRMVARFINGFPVDKEDLDEKEGQRFKKKRPMEEIITGPELDLQNATFEFDESVLDIIEILKEREAQNALLAEQTAEKSAEEYRALCEQAGTKWITQDRLKKLLGVSGLERLLSPFNGRLTDLRIEAFGFLALEDYPEMVTVSKLVQETGIYYTKLLHIMHHLGIPEVLLMATNGVESRTIDRRYIRDIMRYNGYAERALLHWPDEPTIEDDEVFFTEAIADIAPGMSKHAFALALKEAGLIRHRQYIFANHERSIATSMQRSQVDRLGEYLASLPLAEDGASWSTETIAELTGHSIEWVYRIMGELRIKGQCLRSPNDKIIRIFLNQKDTNLVIKELDKQFPPRRLGDVQK